VFAARNNGTDSGNEDDEISFEEVVAFHLFFWMAIALFVVFMLAANCISTIGIPSDSPLLRNLPDIYKPQGQIMRELI
jgi:hypothetical protein